MGATCERGWPLGARAAVVLSPRCVAHREVIMSRWLGRAAEAGCAPCRSYERAVFTAIMLTALGRLGQENGASTLARLAAWNKRQVELFERKAERDARRLARKAWSG